MPCAIPPLDQTEVLIGRGYGLGYNRERTSRDQLHAGMDFVASTGSPVLAPVDGVVDFVSSNTGSRISADAARGGATGQVRQMGGYGNSVVLRHELAIPGLPNPFYTSYNHLSAVAPGIVPGARVTTGMLLGQVGNTTNGQFPGMGAHLHMELRRVPFPGSYARDTVDPNMLWSAVGIDWVGGRTEVERRVGGQLLIRADGPSGPTACPRTATGLAGASSRGWGPLVAASIPFGVPGVPFVGVRPSALGYEPTLHTETVAGGRRRVRVAERRPPYRRHPELKPRPRVPGQPGRLDPTLSHPDAAARRRSRFIHRRA